MKAVLVVLTLTAGALAAEDGVAYQFNLRADRAGSAVEGLGGASGGGGGFAVVLGREPLRLRARMDGDTFPGRAGADPVNAFGLGLEAVLVVPTASPLHPFLALGPAFQQWHVGVPQGRSANHAAFRAEAGVWYKEHLLVCAGVLAGPALDGRRAACPYLGLGFGF